MACQALLVVAIDGIILLMNTKQRKVLKKIMTTPALVNIRFDEVVACLQAMGYEFEQREGSRVCFSVNGEELPIHKPHPDKELKRYVVRNLQQFIKQTEKLL